MTKSAFEINKGGERTNADAWLKETPIVAHGYIVEVIDMNTVRVQQTVQKSTTPDIYTVKLLSFGSGLKEDVVMPKINDTVLLLFLQRYDAAMFEDVLFRKASTKLSYIENEDPHSYDKFSGIGVLAKLVTGRATDVTTYDSDASGSTIFRRVYAKVGQVFNKAFSLVFDSVQTSASGTPAEEPVSVSFGAASPLSITSKSGVSISFKKGALIETEEGYTLNATGDIAITGSEIHLNGDGKSFVTYAALNTELQRVIGLIVTHSHPSNGSPSGQLTGLVLDLSAAATSTVLTDG